MDKIKQSSCHENTKSKLQRLIAEVSYRHSLFNGINELRQQYNKYDIENLLKRLDELEVNPITISRNECIEFNKDYLLNLLEYFSQ